VAVRLNLARGADHELRLEHDLAVPVCGIAGHLVDEQFGRGVAEPRRRLTDRSERHGGRGGEDDVVVTGDRHVVRHAQAAAGHHLQDAEREQVVHAENGGGADALGHRGKLLAGLAAGRDVEIGGGQHPQGAGRQAGRPQRRLRTGQAIADLLDRYRPADDTDPLVTLRCQMRHRELSAGQVVHRHRALPIGRRAVDEHHGHPRRAQLLDPPRAAAGHRRDQHPVPAQLLQQAQVPFLALGAVGAVAHDHRQTPLLCRDLHTRGQVSEERVAGIEHDEADHPAVAGP
jgi:hypothetical protein